MKRNLLFLLIAIVCVGTFLRFYKLAEIPSGLEQDETSIGYNAYSILKTGKDEYGVRLPLYFKAFGEYKLPGYIYASVIPIRIFGLNALGVRFVSALSGALTIILIFALTQTLFEKHKARDHLALLSAALLALNPWHIHFSRGAFEVTLALFFICVGILCFYRSLKLRQLWSLLMSALFLSLSLYTYNISRLFIPMLGITLLVLYHKEVMKLPRKWIYCSVVATAIFLLPFLANLVGKGGVSSTTGTLIFTSHAVQAPLLEVRSVINLRAPVLAKIFFNVPLLTLYQYIQNAASYLSVEYLFLTGAIHGNHGIGTDGQFYLFQLPLIVGGIYLLAKNPKTGFYLLISWTVEIILIASLTREAPQATRSFNLIIPVTIFSSVGLFWLWEQLNRFSGKLKLALSLGFLAVVSLSVSHYLISYFFRFPVSYALQWNEADKEVVDYIRANQDSYNHIIFDQRISYPYTSLLFYLPYNPATFQDNVVRAPDDIQGFSHVNGFEKFEFTNVNWGALAKKHDTHTLVITTKQFLPENISFNILKTIYYPVEPHVLSKDEQFFFFSQHQEAYEILRAN